MKRNKQNSSRRRARKPHWRIAMALAGLATLAAFALGGGARAERATSEIPSLESLLRQREALDLRPDSPRPSVEEVRDRHRKLGQRRADIEGSLPPTLRTPRSRRPGLRKPKRDLANRQKARGVDLDRGNPDRVVFHDATEVPR